jgi:chitinase
VEAWAAVLFRVKAVQLGHETAMVKYFTYKGNSWVGYDDADTYALKEAYANDRCLGGIMIWSIDFDDETGIGLVDGNDYKSPESATVIPMAHTTVPAGQTFTLGSGAATDIPRLPAGGNLRTMQLFPAHHFDVLR